ncbi:hypothetical protein HY546_03750, partial [archaeon]|nr:hypothetical protein [archaeon]
MTYIIEIKEPALKKLRSFNKETQRRFAKRVERLAENPQAFGKPLRNVLSGYWEDYFEKSLRIVYD